MVAIGYGGYNPTWYSGTAVPSTTHLNGDMYLRTSTGDIYQQQSSAWVLVGNIEGPAGPTGPTGPTGPAGPGVTVPLTLSGSQSAASILTVTNTASAPSTEALVITSQSSGDRSLGIQVTGDTNRRLAADSTGKLQWGPGNAAQDTNLYRTATGILATDNSLMVGVAVYGSVSASGTLTLSSTSNATKGKILIGTVAIAIDEANVRLGVGTASPGVTLDVTKADGTGPVLRVTDTTSGPTNPIIQVVANAAGDRSLGVQVAGDTVRRWIVDSNGRTNWGPGGSTAADTVLYRTAAGVLSTDNTFTATTGLQVGSATTGFGGGTGIVGLSDAAVVPTTNPTGGLCLYADQDVLKWRSSNGDIYAYSDTSRDELNRLGYETLPRWACTSSTGISSGSVYLMPVWLPKGWLLSNFNWFNAVTAGVTPTHQWAALYNSGYGQLAITADKTNTAIPAVTLFTWPVATIASGAASSFTTTYAGLHYFGLMIAAGTTPTPAGAALVSPVNAGVPAFGLSDTTQTTPPAFPHTAATPSSHSTPYIYAYLN